MKYLLSLLMLLMVLTSCATMSNTDERELSDKVKSQEPADSPQMIVARAAEAFSAAPGLTAEQKLKIHAIYTRVFSESMQIRREIGQSKSLLFMSLANKDFKADEMNRLKKKVVELDQKRLQIMFDAYEDVQKIVGKGAETEKIYRHFYENEIPRRFDY